MIQQLLASCQGIIQNGSSPLHRSTGSSASSEPPHVEVAEEVGAEVAVESGEKGEAEDVKPTTPSSSPSVILKSSTTTAASAPPAKSTT